LAGVADAAGVQAIYAPWCATPVSFELTPPTADEMARRIAAITRRHPWLVCTGADGLWGYAYASPHRERPAYRWSVDVSVYVAEGRRRGGVGRALYTSLFAALVLQGYVNAYAGVTLPNPGSVGLHESLGFRPVGVYHAVGFKNGAWHDVGWWERELRPRAAAPQEPLAFEAVRAAPGWADALAAGRPLLRV
jgi:phosphinothricin acetyltransferase